MKIYKVPTKTVLVFDQEKMIEDLKEGPVYLSKEDYSTYKALVMYMRNRGLGQLRPAAKTITYLIKGEEIEVMRLTLRDDPINSYEGRTVYKVLRVADGEVFESLNKAMEDTEMPKGARNFSTVFRRLKSGKSMHEASCGAFKEAV